MAGSLFSVWAGRSGSGEGRFGSLADLARFARLTEVDKPAGHQLANGPCRLVISC